MKNKLKISVIRPGIISLDSLDMDWLEAEERKGIIFDSETTLLGGWKNPAGKLYIIDDVAEYSAKLDSMQGYPVITVYHSRNVINTLNAPMCVTLKTGYNTSPMGDLDNPHEQGIPTYALPIKSKEILQ